MYCEVIFVVEAPNNHLSDLNIGHSPVASGMEPVQNSNIERVFPTIDEQRTKERNIFKISIIIGIFNVPP